ncbi:MAG: type II toxin-antitoxin system PemK/MazF family toxin [Armatimonadetes bacterium]|nr:type II toxin-antitoxin system PemK/MazF family toxin [Armatimonadota bacterium]
MTHSKPSRGDIWLVDPNPVRGHEQAGRRPGLVVSVDGFNHGPAGLVILVPITTRERGIPFHVRLDPGDSGLRQASFAKCEDVRSVAAERLVRRMGSAPENAMSAVEDSLRILLGL